MSQLTGLQSHDARAGGEDFLAVHFQRSEDALQQQAAASLTQIAPNASVAVLFMDKSDEERVVELAQGPSCPFNRKDRVAADAWSSDTLKSLPLDYGQHRLGDVLIDGVEDERVLALLRQLVTHYAVALVNLKLNDEALRTSDQYYAGLQALEEGVILFQERDKEAVSARFLSLLTSLLGTAPGAIYLLEEPGKLDSALQLETALGVPEAMLEELVLPDGTWWPGTVIEAPPQVLLRGGDGELPLLDNGRVPPALTSVVTCPLRYHGLTVGIGLALNCNAADTKASKLESLRRLGELGAAIFHRIRLEEMAVRSQEVETELSIAAHIQARLMPTEAPASNAIQCAWSSSPARMVGGDFLDLVTDADDNVHAVIADVSGHGINSALLMSSFRATYRAECSRNGPGELLAVLNHEICNETGDTGMFVTAATFRIQGDGRRATFASAGHNDVFLYRAGSGSVEALESTGPSTGFFPESDYGVADVELEAGDVLLLYTDGLVEARRAGTEFEMFGDDRLKGLLVQHCTEPPNTILTAILDDLASYAGTEMHEDDVSVTVIRVV